jgi:hypothetical protein
VGVDRPSGTAWRTTTSLAPTTPRIDGTSRNWFRDRWFSRRFPSGRFEENPGSRCLGIAVSAASSTGCNSLVPFGVLVTITFRRRVKARTACSALLLFHGTPSWLRNVNSLALFFSIRFLRAAPASVTQGSAATSARNWSAERLCCRGGISSNRICRWYPRFAEEGSQIAGR